MVLQLRHHDFIARANVLLAQVLATRLMASVAPRTKMISLDEPAPIKRATLSRAAS